MTLTINQTKLTAKKYLMLGEDPPGVRLELIHGEIGVSPSPSYPHTHVILELAQILGPYVKANDLGRLAADLDTTFGEWNVRRPDFSFVAKSRVHLIRDHGFPFSPGLCVEVISPSSDQMDREDKFSLYEEHGVPNYWIIDPTARSFEAFRLENGKYVLAISGRDAEVVHASPFEALDLPLENLWTDLGHP